MPVEWYIKQHGKTRGPITSKQLRALAGRTVVTPESPVRKGKLGEWVPAARIKGLFDTSHGAPPAAKGPQVRSNNGTGSTGIGEDGQVLEPQRRVRLRVISLATLVGFVCIGPAPWYQKLLFALSMLLIFGAYPVIVVTEKYIEQTIIVGFYPAHRKRWKLREFTAVETEMEQRITETFGLLVLFFWVFWLLFRIFDFLMPWMGGNYKLYLRQFDDERLLIWQGNNDADYETNRDILEDAVQRFGFRL